MPRDKFLSPVKRELAMRAAHFCSNPQCLRLTSGPRSGGIRGLGTGHAAHICAASPKGPRFDPDQDENTRRSSANGLWLCRECGDLVDKDFDGYSVETLHTWKRTHEAMIAEVRQKGWAKSLELLRASQNEPGVATASSPCLKTAGRSGLGLTQSFLIGSGCHSVSCAISSQP